MDIQLILTSLTLLSVILGWGVGIGALTNRVKQLEDREKKLEEIQSTFVSEDKAKIIFDEKMQLRINGFATKADIEALKNLIGLKLEILERNVADINQALCEINGRFIYTKKKKGK